MKEIKNSKIKEKNKNKNQKIKIDVTQNFHEFFGSIFVFQKIHKIFGRL